MTYAAANMGGGYQTSNIAGAAVAAAREAVSGPRLPGSPVFCQALRRRRCQLIHQSDMHPVDAARCCSTVLYSKLTHSLAHSLARSLTHSFTLAGPVAPIPASPRP